MAVSIDFDLDLKNLWSFVYSVDIRLEIVLSLVQSLNWIWLLYF
jgi:hypothetical protein